jgi:transposase
MELNPLSGSVFLFCNRSRKLLKAVWWDQTGFWLSQKRLEKDKFPWPEHEQAAEEIRVEEVNMLLSGIDFWKAHKPLFIKKFHKRNIHRDQGMIEFLYDTGSAGCGSSEIH